ncbi:MAG TPA: hypothetical protein VNW95_07345 [Mucilaginibacter sp.]|jgi:hypothetical protein|nr:hypothetical protein [Mucilaginibacter sp.]
MKFPSLIILAALILYGCKQDKKTTANANELAYATNDTTSGVLSAKLDLVANGTRNSLTAAIKLNNTDAKPVEIEEILISTTDGIRSLPETGSSSMNLRPGTDTAFSLQFHPLSDLKLYQVTGMPGFIKPAYNLLISYKTTGIDSLKTLTLKSQTQPGTYQNFARKYKKNITGYSFNTRTDFNENQEKYLKTIKQAGQTPFVYLSEQEIAVSGLNFRLKSYAARDTLHAELFVVNHADFAVKIIPDAFDITSSKTGASGSRSIHLERLSGMQHDSTMMEKGDRVLIHFKKYLNPGAPEKENLVLHLTKAFMLTGRKNLFNEDVQLLPVSCR